MSSNTPLNIFTNKWSGMRPRSTIPTIYCLHLPLYAPPPRAKFDLNGASRQTSATTQLEVGSATDLLGIHPFKVSLKWGPVNSPTVAILHSADLGHKIPKNYHLMTTLPPPIFNLDTHWFTWASFHSGIANWFNQNFLPFTDSCVLPSSQAGISHPSVFGIMSCCIAVLV